MATTKLIAEYFDSLAESWDSQAQHSQTGINAMLTLADLQAGIRILDAGCGTGVLEDYLTPFHPSQVTGVDVSERMIQVAMKKHPESRYICADILEYECEQPFQTVLIYNAFPYFLKRSPVLAKTAECLESGGRLMIFHNQSREEMNAHHATMPEGLSMVLPSAHTLAGMLEDRYNVDIVVDTPQFYAVSGIKR